ncbi:hypothetical protein CGH26_25585, partial [Vibrio parahaemolyticus]
KARKSAKIHSDENETAGPCSFQMMGTHTQIVKFLKVSRTSVNKLVQSFLEERQEKPSIGGLKNQNRNDP